MPQEQSKRAKAEARRITKEIEATKSDETSSLHPQMRVYGEGDLQRFHKHDWIYYHTHDCPAKPVTETTDDTITSTCDKCGVVVASTLSTVGATKTRIGRKNAWS